MPHSHFIHIHEEKDKHKVESVEKAIQDNKDVFVLFYWKTCIPCQETHPHWEALEKNSHVPKDDDLYVVDIEQDQMDPILQRFPYIKEKVQGFPTMVYIKNGKAEPFEEAEVIRSIEDPKKRQTKYLSLWIQDKTGLREKNHTMKGGSQRIQNKKTKSKTMKNLTQSDYTKILQYYKQPVPNTTLKMRKKSQKILSLKLCKCINKIGAKNPRSVGICTRSVFNKKGLTRGKFACVKKKRSVAFTKRRK
jgi:thiol-disulfide isomerase/thioredoxin